MRGASITNVSRSWGYFRLHDESITMSANYLRALHAEGARLAKRVTSTPAWLLVLLSYPARVQRKIQHTAAGLRRRELFPGLVQANLDNQL
jgi:hypothetical protein